MPFSRPQQSTWPASFVRSSCLCLMVSTICGPIALRAQGAEPRLFGPTVPEPAGGSVRLAAQANETVRRVRPRLDLIAPRGVATRADETPDRLMLDLMPGRELRATRTSLATTSGGSVIWSGAADDDPGSLVTLTVNGDVMVGDMVR